MMRSWPDLEIPVRDDATELTTFERGPRVLGSLRGIGVNVAGADVIDLGAGFGSLSLASAREGAKSVLAVDVNPARLAAIDARAAALGLDVATVQANLLEPWSPRGIADIAFLIGVVEYAGLWDPSRPVRTLQRDVLRSAVDALRPGGLLVFASKNRLWPRFVVRDSNTGLPLVNALPRPAADRVARKLRGVPYRHHIHSPRAWSQLIREAGIADTRHFVPYLSYQFPLRLVERGSFRDQRAAARAIHGPEERRVAWGRYGALKAAITSTAGIAGAPVAHGVFVIGTKA
jgi:SAM-dependent methyltransferase